MNDRLTNSLRAGLKWMRRHPMEWLRRRPMAVALLVVALLLGVGLLAGVLFPPPADDEESGPASNDEVSRNARSDFRLEAVAGDAIGIETDTEFLLTSERDLATDTIRGMLRIVPEVEIQITKAGAGRYTVSPTEPLDSGTLYRFTSEVGEDGSQAPASWAFQTKSPIQIVQTLPRNQGTQVPLNTGIEVTFSHDGVENIEDHWQISPPVQGRFELHKRVAVFVPKELQANTLYTVTITSGLGVRGTNDVMAEDKVFQFETGGGERSGFVDFGPALGFTRKVNEAGTQETPAFELYSSRAPAGPVTIAAYRYPTILHFLDALQQYQSIPTWAYLTRERYAAPTDNLILQTTFETELQELG
ncbi:MAG: Ig-like domain-containing protein, partial [Chloroflexi bacterium]|nr:Ig-like domain-containing protein [Chloroflexota bacterium]